MVRNVGDVDAAFANGATILEAEYYTPHLAHVSMEPPVAAVDVRDGKAYCWAPTQDPQQSRRRSPTFSGSSRKTSFAMSPCWAEASGANRFRISSPKLRCFPSKLQKPVKVVWSREDDIRF